MMRQYDLVERVQRYNPRTNEDLLNRAYVYAMKAHGSQKRASGEAYFNHPLEVAAILTEQKVDDATIVAALLHDTVEDTTVTIEDIRAKFGPDIAGLVDGLTKLAKLDLVVKQALQAENLRKLLLAMVSDIRVLLVKLADRLHNMRTISAMREDKRRRIAQETLDIYAPLAGRMGMQDMRDELEDLSFEVVNPEAFRTIVSRLAKTREALADRMRLGGVEDAPVDVIAYIEGEIRTRLREEGLKAVVYGRQKRPYSIFRKSERRHVEFSQLSDIYGFRVIVETVPDCYRALGILHTSWPAVPARYKDYISTPKQNDYRSIHTTVIGPGRQRVEMQIRTRDMHEIAEYGVAAHAVYKDGGFAEGARPINTESRAFAWLARTVEHLSQSSAPEEFLEHTKLELFQDQVFCFTPKGKLIALPRGATPIDFAYAVHTDVGNTTVGARVNGKISPLAAELRNGDEVEILTSKTSRPAAAWEEIAITGKARYEIRRATREQIRGQYAEMGRVIVKRVFERNARAFGEERVQLVLKRLARNTVEDVMAAVGRGEMLAADVLRAVYPDWKEERSLNAGTAAQGEGWVRAPGTPGVKFKAAESDAAPPIRGLQGDIQVRFAPEGGAVPGDRIVGIVMPGEGVTIYPIQSETLRGFEDLPADRWVDVRWAVEPDDPRRYAARVALQTVNEPGTLQQIAQAIAENDGNIDNIRMSRRTAESTDIVIDLEVWDLKHLTGIMAQLKSKSVVSDVRRVIG